MHPTTFLAVHRWRPPRLARTSLGTAARAGQHRPGIARVIAGHLPGSRLDGTVADARSPTIGIVGICEWLSASGDAAALSLVVSCAACVTLPTIAWPPSLTDTFCTVTF